MIWGGTFTSVTVTFNSFLTVSFPSVAVTVTTYSPLSVYVVSQTPSLPTGSESVSSTLSLSKSLVLGWIVTVSPSLTVILSSRPVISGGTLTLRTVSFVVFSVCVSPSDTVTVMTYSPALV